MQKSQMAVRRLVLSAMLAALYVIFAAFLTVKTPIVEISLSSLPILLAAALFGWVAVPVAFIGAFLEQLISFGLSPTTLLWVAPTVLMAVVAALLMPVVQKSKSKLPLLLVILICELLYTVFGTAALYIDGAIMEYSVEALDLIALPRLGNCAFRAAITMSLVPLLVNPLTRFTVGRK